MRSPPFFSSTCGEQCAAPNVMKLVQTMHNVVQTVMIPLLFFWTNVFAETNNRALVIIDMQEVFIKRSGPQFGGIKEYRLPPENQAKVDSLISAQVQAIQEAKRNNTPIIFIEHVSANEATNGRLLFAANGAKFVKFFLKMSDGAFESFENDRRFELKRFLRQANADTLIVMGANGGACVKKTISGALEDGYSVIAYTPGIADFNFSDFIYPYDLYDEDTFKIKCKKCTFRESSTLSEIFSTNGPEAPEGPFGG